MARESLSREIVGRGADLGLGNGTAGMGRAQEGVGRGAWSDPNPITAKNVQMLRLR